MAQHQEQQRVFGNAEGINDRCEAIPPSRWKECHFGRSPAFAGRSGEISLSWRDPSTRSARSG